MQHLIVNITWQSDYWQEQSSVEDVRSSGFGYVAEHKMGHEERNFNLAVNIDEQDRKVGYFPITGTRDRQTGEYKPKQVHWSDSGRGIVFFRSTKKFSPGKGMYIVGLYALAEVDNVGRFDMDGHEANIRAPANLCVRWADAQMLSLPITNEVARLYFPRGNKPLQASHVYIHDQQAKKIIRDAYAAHSSRSADDLAVRRKLREVWKAVWHEEFRVEDAGTAGEAQESGYESVQPMSVTTDEPVRDVSIARDEQRNVPAPTTRNFTGQVKGGLSISLPILHGLLVHRLNREEVKRWCFYMSDEVAELNYSRMSGDELSEVLLDLLETAKRLNQRTLLIEKLHEVRSDILGKDNQHWLAWAKEKDS